MCRRASDQNVSLLTPKPAFSHYVCLLPEIKSQCSARRWLCECEKDGGLDAQQWALLPGQSRWSGQGSRERDREGGEDTGLSTIETAFMKNSAHTRTWKSHTHTHPLPCREQLKKQSNNSVMQSVLGWAMETQWQMSSNRVWPQSLRASVMTTLPAIPAGYKVCLEPWSQLPMGPWGKRAAISNDRGACGNTAWPWPEQIPESEGIGAGIKPSGHLWRDHQGSLLRRLPQAPPHHHLVWLTLVFFPLFLGLHCGTHGILFPDQGLNLCPSAVEAQSLNHWTSREVPHSGLSELHWPFTEFATSSCPRVLGTVVWQVAEPAGAAGGLSPPDVSPGVPPHPLPPWLCPAGPCGPHLCAFSYLSSPEPCPSAYQRPALLSISPGLDPASAEESCRVQS